MELPKGLLDIHGRIRAAGGRPMLVGGCVRDEIMGFEPKDFDTEVYALSPDVLQGVLGPDADLTGRSFGVFRVRSDGHEFEFSIPRRDNKAGVGHKDFRVSFDPWMSIRDAAKRRDFTMNSLAYDPDTGALHDPFDGRSAIKYRTLEATSEHFAEDPLRVLRGMQFAARFDMTVGQATKELCRSISAEIRHLPKERIWGEWRKWAEMSRRPSAGINFLRLTGWLENYSEIESMISLPQDKEYHPEGCVYTHTLLVCDAATAIADRDGLAGDDRVTLLLAALCHDFGKATTTEIVNHRIRSPGHADAGVPIAGTFLDAIGCPPAIKANVQILVREHMYDFEMEVTTRIAKRLQNRLGDVTIEGLMRLCEADRNGRPPLPGGLPENGRKLMEMKTPPVIEPILKGRHLIDRGWKPGVEMGRFLKAAFEAQLDEAFVDLDGATAWMEKTLDVG